MPSTTTAILWDNDGVLVDTERLYLMATQRALASVGIELTREQYIDFFLVRGVGAWHLAEESGLSPERITQLHEERNAIYREYLRSERLMLDGVQDVLDALRGKYVMGVVTGSRRDHFDLMHRSTGLAEYFDFIVASNDFTRSKPDPEPYRIAIERSGLSADECIAVEDTERGLRSATAAGLKCIVVPNELTAGGDFSGAHRVLASLTDILAEL